MQTIQEQIDERRETLKRGAFGKAIKMSERLNLALSVSGPVLEEPRDGQALLWRSLGGRPVFETARLAKSVESLFPNDPHTSDRPIPI